MDERVCGKEATNLKPYTFSPDRQARLGQISQVVSLNRNEDPLPLVFHSERADIGVNK